MAPAAKGKRMEFEKILIQNADWILTFDEKRRMFRNADMLVKGNQIEKIGKNLPLEGPEGRIKCVDAKGRIVIPGMVNAHHHCTHTVLRNLPYIYETELSSWLKAIYALLEFMDEDAMYAATLGAFGDLLKTGCTTSVDHQYVFPGNHPNMMQAQLEAARRLGIRFHVMRGSLSRSGPNGCEHVPQSLAEPVDKMLKECTLLIERHHNPKSGAMVQVGLAPCWLVYETAEMLKETLRLATHYGVCLHSHLADSRQEFAFSVERHGCTPVEYAEKMGYLQKNSVFAHCIQLTRSDIALLAKNEVGVAYCANSDMVLRSGVARVSDFLRRRMKVGLGVDGAASNNMSNMIAEVKSAYVIQRSYEIQKSQKREDTGPQTEGEQAITPENMLYMATVGGAKALGRSDIGYLAPGMMADFVMLDWGKLQYAGGKYDPVAAIVLSGDARMVDRVFVNGKQVVEKGELLSLDETKAAAKINQQAALLLKRHTEAKKADTTT